MWSLNIFEMNKRSWRQLAVNCAAIFALLVLLMVLIPTHHEQKPVFAADGTFQLSSQEMVKHFKLSKWQLPSHELLTVKDFYDYIEKPRSSCVSSVMLGGRSCSELEDHTVCLDPSLQWDHDTCLVYEFGSISKTFERAITLLGCEVHSFSPSAHHRTDQRRGDRSWYYRIQLEGNVAADASTDGEVLSLAEVRRRLGHGQRRIDYMLLDLEGEEWSALRRMLSTRVLDNVNQLGIQVALDAAELAPRQRLEHLRRMYQVLVGLEHSGLRLVSSRPQGANVPCDTQLPELGSERNVCEFYELVYARRLGLPSETTV